MFLLPAVTYAAKYTSPCTDWLVIFLESTLDINNGYINIHTGLRGYVAFHYIFHIFEAEYTLVYSLNHYHLYVSKSILTDETLTLGVCVI